MITKSYQRFEQTVLPSQEFSKSSRLTSNKDVQRNYTRSLDTKINIEEYKSDDINPRAKLKSLMKVIKTTAADIVGIRKPTHRANHSNDGIVVGLCEERRLLRLQLNHNISANRTLMRCQINRKQKQIKQRLKQLRCEAADHLAHTIASTDESRRMFEAVRVLTNSRPARPITVHNEEGHVVGTDSEKAEIVKSWFETHFTGEEPPLAPFDGAARSLNTPISPNEVSCAIKRLKNNRACGSDEVPNELLKYAGTSFCSAFSDIINQCFVTTHISVL